MVDEVSAETWQIIEGTVGQTLACVHFVAYRFQDEIRTDNTLLQLSFVDGSVVFLDSAGDGESLRAGASAWVDPFVGKLDRENEEFVQTSGQWVLMNMSSVEPFKSLIGQAVQSVQPVFSQAGKLSGVGFTIAEQCLGFAVEYDEGHILWEKCKKVPKTT